MNNGESGRRPRGGASSASGAAGSTPQATAGRAVRTEAPPDTRPAADRRVVGRLILGSSLMLFCELALIRWLGSNIVHLSYFSNFVLLGSFLGIGLGFLIAKKRWTILPFTPVVLAALVAWIYFNPVTIDRTGDKIIYFTSLSTNGPPAWIVLPVVFVLVAIILAGPAEVVGRCFGELSPLTAYRWDLVGSLIGICAFTLLSFLRAPSMVWGILVALAFVALVPRWPRILAVVSGAGLITVLVLETLTPGITWSPYYKVKTDLVYYGSEQITRISVNGVPHQEMWDAQVRLRTEPQYGLPYQHVVDNPLGNVLIVGAGSGSDVAITLSKGAQHVDAVDIDPRILQIGEQKNPNQPYEDPRVTVHNNDGRAFLSSTNNKYDLILFALPDSLALVNGASQIRLESFLFTEEALKSAHDHLNPGGLFAMYNYYRDEWLIDRLAGTAAAGFGHQPRVDKTGGGQAVVSVGYRVQDQNCESQFQPAGTSYAPAGAVIAPATDDRPFLYFKGGSIPSMYLWVLAGILAISVIAVRGLGGPFRSMRPYADLFFMGAAFLLLETKNVATFALLFGTTWLVNALVFAGVLIIVLAAVETTRKFRTPPLPVIFGGIAVALALAWIVRPEWLLPLPFIPRLLLAVLLAFLPIYLANIAFAKRFAGEGDSRSAFGINLLGAIVGGCLEYSALLTGYRNLLIVVAVLYGLAFLLKPRAAALVR